MAGPGVGKSTLMAQLFARLKILGYEVEKDETEFVIIAKILEILKNENRS